MEFYKTFLLLYLFVIETNSRIDNDSSSSEEHPIDEKKRIFFIPFFAFLIPTFNLILKTTDTTAGAAIGATISESMALTDKRSILDDIPFNLQVIERKINKNYVNAVKLKQLATYLDPSVQDIMFVSKEGFKCDHNFCSGMKKELYSFGICSQYVCECGKIKPIGLKCAQGMVYDPVYKVCDKPLKVKICGF